MARTDKYKEKIIGKDVDLVPVMNLMAILVPMLLVSTEYIKITTLAVSSPSIGPSQPVQVDPDDKPPLNLTIAISSNGFYIASANNVLPGSEEAGAAQPGPTIPKVMVKVYRGREANTGKVGEVERVWEFEGKKYVLAAKEISATDLQERLDGLALTAGTLQQSEELDYNYPALFEKLKVIKKAFENETKVIVSADPDIRFSTIVRVMDASRLYVNDAGEKVFMFPQVVLSAGIV
ncbi:MAG: hypothetical protein C4523_21335 [Myxococcales bacterium]|nr:MAG: hypothetical protein C4523_21335 [Myxococcales bacterium]